MQENIMWAIVEVDGNRRYAGRYSERGQLHRLDVIDGRGDFTMTRLWSDQVIREIVFTDEDTARAVAGAIEASDILLWQPAQRRLVSPPSPGVSPVVEAG